MIKWTSITFATIVVAKVLAYQQRGYLAYGEELVAVAWVVIAYWALHSDWFKSVKRYLKNKKRLCLLAQNTSSANL